MTYTVPPAAKPPALQDVSHPPAPAAAPAAPPAVPSGPPVPAAALQDVNHTPAAPAAPVQPGPVSSSTPLPLPEPSDVQYSPVTADAPVVKEKVQLGSGIEPETVVGAGEKAAAVRKTPAAVPSPMAPPVAQAEIYEVGQIVGGVVAPPVVALAPGAPTVHRDTPYSISAQVRSHAEKNGVDLSTVTPTGKGGRIVRKDIDSAIAAAALEAAKSPPTPADAVTETAEIAAEDTENVEAAAVEEAAEAAVEVTEALADAQEESDADILPFARDGIAVHPPIAVARSLADDDEEEDEDTAAVAPEPTTVAPAPIAPAAVPAPAAEPAAEAVAVQATFPGPAPVTAQTPAGEAAPAVEDTAAVEVVSPAVEEPVTVEEPAAAVEEPVAVEAAASGTATLRVPINLDDGPVLVPSPDELKAVAQAFLPALRVVSAYVEISTSAPILVVGVATTLTLEVSL